MASELLMTFLFFGFFGSNFGRSTGSDVEKFDCFPPTAFSLLVGPKNPIEALVPMSIPLTGGMTSG